VHSRQKSIWSMEDGGLREIWKVVIFLNNYCKWYEDQLLIYQINDLAAQGSGKSLFCLNYYPAWVSKIQAKCTGIII
jgi:hypothetical protein